VYGYQCYLAYFFSSLNSFIAWLGPQCPLKCVLWQVHSRWHARCQFSIKFCDPCIFSKWRKLGARNLVNWPRQVLAQKNWRITNCPTSGCGQGPSLHHHHLQLAPLQVCSATGHQQPPESVLGQVKCVSPWQPMESRSFSSCLHPGHPRLSWRSLPIHRRRGSQDLLSVYIVVHSGGHVRCRAWITSVSRRWLVWHRTSSLEMKWYHLMPRSIQRLHWWSVPWPFLNMAPLNFFEVGVCIV